MSENSKSGSSVWYFVGAVFIFVMPILLFKDIPVLGRIVFIVLGMIVMVLGFIQLKRDSDSQTKQ